MDTAVAFAIPSTLYPCSAMECRLSICCLVSFGLNLHKRKIASGAPLAAAIIAPLR